MDGPLNFAWRIDFPHVLSGAPTTTIAGEFSLVNQAQHQQELTSGNRTKLDSGFDLIVGNPPFVTARNAEKRELYRERWPRVCYQKFLLVCPFFEMSFRLLRPNGQLGFIVSNAFAKREFGKPLVEDFFSTIDLQKIVDCSGLMFPGHGTPTCIVFGQQQKPTREIPIRMVMILPSGGDLRTIPEESPLWETIAIRHGYDAPTPLPDAEKSDGYRQVYEDSRIVVGDCVRSRILSHPCVWSYYDWPTTDAISRGNSKVLRDILDDDLGVCTMTNSDEVLVLNSHEVRRLIGEVAHIRQFQEADMQRDWTNDPDLFAVFPYTDSGEVISPKGLSSKTLNYLQPYKHALESRRSFGNKTFKELGRVWYEHERMNRTKYSHKYLDSWALVATHIHALPNLNTRLLKQTNIVATIASLEVDDVALVAALMNASAPLFWAKQVCFSRRESEESTTDNCFEFAGAKVQQLPIPTVVGEVLRGKSEKLAIRLVALARECWQRGNELPSLALKQLFQKSGEAYLAWNSSLPGLHQTELGDAAPFSSMRDLEKNLANAQEIRERIRSEMIAQQEEMDWLMYAAYGLTSETDPAVVPLTEDVDLALDREQRPFCLWSRGDCDFDKAAALIPASWSANKKKLWRARLEAIRDNEHIRRIEQPVYKRRWDEQWKVGNRWECGPVAYSQELIDAFTWWLSEKAEWHLEHKLKGGPIPLPDWSAALFKDTRIAAAWPVIADAIYEVEKYKFDALDEEKKETRRKPKADDSYTAFEKFFRDIILDQSVAHGIPPAISWDELAKKNKWTKAELKKAQAIRGKLNVPRERFQPTSDSQFVWAGAK